MRRAARQCAARCMALATTSARGSDWETFSTSRLVVATETNGCSRNVVPSQRGRVYKPKISPIPRLSLQGPTMRESVFWKTDWFLAAVIAQVRLGLSRTALVPGLNRLLRASVFSPRVTPLFKGWRLLPWAGGAFGTSALGLATVPLPTYIFNYPDGRSACTSDAIFFPLPAKIPPDEYGKRTIPMGDTAAPVGISRVPPLSHGMPPVFTLAHSVSLAPEKYLSLDNSTGDSDGNDGLRPCSALLGVAAAAPGEWSGSGSDGGRRRVVAGGSPFACRQVLRTGGARRGGVGYLLGGPGARTDSCPGLRDGGRVEKPMRSRKQVNEQLGSGATRPAYLG